ncbi:MAG: hypothetical protein HC873_13775, partial [Leptolyngbyaceae cyanobacterium SL_1_1]|nr:hypothetical protein [Leptolyngbyaceae cyanobacterium SL_1_1]
NPYPSSTRRQTCCGDRQASFSTGFARDRPPDTDLSALWQTVIAAVESNATKMLLRQWGCLLKFDGEKAQIGITERWLKSTKEDRQPMIEKAFQKAKARAITVTFTAVSADTIRAFQEQRTPAEAVSQTLQEGPVIAKTAAPPASSPQSGGCREPCQRHSPYQSGVC